MSPYAQGLLNLADQLFLISQDEETGRPRVRDDVRGLALAAALLGELMFTEHLAVADDGTVLLMTRQPPSHDPLAHRVFHRIRVSYDRSRYKPKLDDWITVLAGDACDAVGGRLCDGGLLRREVKRRPFRQVRVFRSTSPSSSAWAAWATMRLHSALHRCPMDTWDATLAAFAYTVDLAGHVTFGCDNQPHPTLGHFTAALPRPLRELLRCTRSQLPASTINRS